MSQLSDTQVRLLRDYLLAAEVDPASPLGEELVDHLACELETRLDDGHVFATAWAGVRREWHPQRLRKTASRRHYLLSTKPKLMRYLLLSATLGLTALLLLNWLPGVTSESSCTAQTHTPLLFPAENPVPARLVSDPPSGSPVADFGPGQVSIGYGWFTHPLNRDRRLHRGIDIRGRRGTPVLATGSGVVIKAAFDEAGYGKHIVIRHDDAHETLYGHLDELLVAEGQHIDRGTVIGKIGSTGLSTGPHLHYEVIKEGKAVDPQAYLP